MSPIAHRLEGHEGAPVVLLLNGGMMSMGAWQEILAVPLLSRYRVLRCDLRGQLLSPGRPPEDIAGHVDDLVALLDHLALETVHVVGASFGGSVGVLLAALRPGRVASLVAITAVDVFDELMLHDVDLLRDVVRRVLAGDAKGSDVYDFLVDGTFSPRYRSEHGAEIAARRALVHALPRTWYEGLEGLLASLHTADLRPHLARVARPALVVAAGEDLAMPAERSRALADGLRAAYGVVPGRGHALVIEDPPAVLAHVAPFLERVSAARSAVPA